MMKACRTSMLALSVCVIPVFANCGLIQQSPVTIGDRESFFEGPAVSAANPAQKVQLSQLSTSCSAHLNSLRASANNVYGAKNIITSLGIVGAATGGIITAADSTNTKAGSITTISSAAVAALAQVITTVAIDPISTRDKYSNATKYWSDAQDDVGAAKFSDTIVALRNCANDVPYPAKAPPPGAPLIVNPTAVH